MERKGHGKVLALLASEILAYRKNKFSRELRDIHDMRKPFLTVHLRHLMGPLCGDLCKPHKCWYIICTVPTGMASNIVPSPKVFGQ